MDNLREVLSMSEAKNTPTESTGISTKREIIGRECKHVVYTKSKISPRKDLLTVKEVVHYSDNTSENIIRKIADYQRPFWITNEMFRNHEQKKEYEEVQKCTKYVSTQADLNNAIVRALGWGNPNRDLPYLARNPYLYGADITSSVLVKERYMSKWPNAITPNRVAVLDIETDVVKGHGDILSISLTSRHEAYLAVTREFIDGIAAPEDQIQAMCQQLLGDVFAKRGIKQVEIHIAETPGLACKWIIERAHEMSPEFIAVWNISFDLPRILSALEKEGFDPADIFSDASVPPEYREARFKYGPTTQTAKSGRKLNLSAAEQWHWFYAPAGFIMIDAMSVYYRIRIAKGKLPSYALDAILNKELDRGKLRFDKAEHVGHGLAWHIFMQTNYPLEYMAYNVFDCIGVELLDEKTQDLSMSITSQCGPSEYYRFKYNPVRIEDDMHFHALKRGLVMGTKPDDVTDPLDDATTTQDGWIITLPAPDADTTDCINPFNDVEDYSTMIWTYVSDADIKSSYPYGQIALNLSKATTRQEICSIKDIHDSVLRKTTLNITGGQVNATEIAQDIYGVPSQLALLDQFLVESEEVA